MDTGKRACGSGDKKVLLARVIRAKTYEFDPFVLHRRKKEGG